MKIDTVRRILRARCRDGVEPVAEQAGVTRGFICHVLAGRKLPGPKVLEYLGLERLEIYRRKRVAATEPPTP